MAQHRGSGRLFILLFVENFLFNTAHGAVSLTSPFLVSLGASRTYLGLFNSINTLALVLVLFLLGKPFLRLNRVSALRWGFVLLILSDTLMGLFPVSLTLLALLKILGTFSFIFCYSFLMNMVYDISSDEAAAGNIGMLGVAGLLSNPVASIAVEAVSSAWGGRAAFFLGAAIAAVALVAALFLREPERSGTPEVQKDVLSILRRRDLWPVITITFFYGAAFTTIMSFLPSYTTWKYGTLSMTAFMLPFAIVSILIRLALTKMGRVQPRKLLAISYASLALSFGGILFAWNPLSLGVIGMIYAVGHSLLFPVLSTIHVRAGGAGEKAAFNNAFILETNIGTMVMVPLVGALGDALGWLALFGSLSLLYGLCIPLVLSRFPAKS